MCDVQVSVNAKRAIGIPYLTSHIPHPLGKSLFGCFALNLYLARIFHGIFELEQLRRVHDSGAVNGIPWAIVVGYDGPILTASFILCQSLLGTNRNDAMEIGLVSYNV